MPDAVEFNYTFHKCSAPRGPNLLSSCLCPLHSVQLVAGQLSILLWLQHRGQYPFCSPPPCPQESYPKEGELVPILSTLGCCPVNAGGVLGEERSFLCLALLSVALAKRVITKFRHHQPPTLPSFPSLPDSLTKRLLILKSRFKSPIPQELSSSSLSPQPKCSTLLFPTPKLQIRSDKNIRL